ncbi:MAG: phytanoyl-CoA dioxygenase [Actinobacteria bacterium]|nr:phytanoyl-CoA dioxygenase [Actinomycetota bacterium]
MREPGWFFADECKVDDLRRIVEVRTELSEYQHASSIEHNVVVYDAKTVRSAVVTPDGRRKVMAEIARALSTGPGVIAFHDAYEDVSVVDRASEVFCKIIEEQHAAGSRRGDHYAKPGANDRVWNSLEKLAMRDASAFIDYFDNGILALVAAAWLGPRYQFTSQVNVVNPGGEAQSPHRDYHLGFMETHEAEMYPEHIHGLSPLLTLQGAVAHTDMPAVTGPTYYLPHSQKYPMGYVAWKRPEFRDFVNANFIQIELKKGDVSFFNPAVFHAAGTNQTSDIRRMANLFQMNSPFGRAIETVDTKRVCLAIYDELRDRVGRGMSADKWLAVVAAAAEGYPFPTNLDRDVPLDRLTPPAQSDIMALAVMEGWPSDRFIKELNEYDVRHRSA